MTLHIAGGNPSKLSKAEFKERLDSEIKIGDSDLDKLKVPSFVRKDVAAYKHWKQCIKEYKAAAAEGVVILTSSDVGSLALYCKTCSEYEHLLTKYQRIEDIVSDSSNLMEYIDNSEEFNYQVKQQLRRMASMDALLRIETAINKKMDMLIKLSDRLFLNPLARVRNVVKPKKEEKPASKFSRFNGGRNGELK